MEDCNLNSEEGDWEQVGGRGQSKKKMAKQQMLTEKGALRQRLGNEKALQLAAEEAEVLTDKKGAKNKSKSGASKTNFKDDADILKESLAGAPKNLLEKEVEAKQKSEKERKLKSKQDAEQARIEKEARRKANDNAISSALQKGMVLNHTDDLMQPINNRKSKNDDASDGEEGQSCNAGANQTNMEFNSTLDVLRHRFGNSVNEYNAEKRLKAIMKSYFDEQLPMLKDEYPGLTLSQYNKKLDDLWKNSPVNPRNQVKVRSRDAWKMES